MPWVALRRSGHGWIGVDCQIDGSANTNAVRSWQPALTQRVDISSAYRLVGEFGPHVVSDHVRSCGECHDESQSLEMATQWW